MKDDIARKKTYQSKFLNQYIRYCVQHRDGTIDGDSRKTNTAYTHLKKLYEQLQQDTALAETVLPILLKNNDIKVSSFAAAHCLGLNMFVSEAEELLKSIATQQIHVLSFNAKMTLEVWREQGFLKF